jgi:hypothetical protein
MLSKTIPIITNLALLVLSRCLLFPPLMLLHLQHHTPAAWRDHPSLSYGTAGEKIHITRVPFGSVGTSGRVGRTSEFVFCFSLSFFFSQFVSAGKYHVEQDPQFALVHLQFVHWADKLLKVTVFVVCVLPLLFLQTMTINLRTLGTARLNASCSPPSLQLIL